MRPSLPLPFVKVCLITVATLLVVISLAGNASAQFVQNHVTFTLEGCRNNGGIVLPNGTGQFICADSAYTTGDLGKGWNELDLVPHRLTTNSGNQSDASTDYDVNLAADYNTSGNIGYDVLALFQVDPNPALSDPLCSISTVGGNQFAGTPTNPFGGGTDVAIYQQVHIHQPKNTTCVFDWVERLALGSHLYPGSSLQSYLALTADLSGSKKTVSIPVNQILPQSLKKDMNATQPDQVNWNITKTPSSANLAFGNVCDQTLPLQQPVTITVDWTTSQPVPNGPITVTTHVYATNPAARVITATVVDKIYLGLTGQTTLLDTVTTAPTDLPANSTTLVITHTFLDQTQTDTAYNDVATATYVDKITGIPIPGQTTATASASVTSSGVLNSTATVEDVESILPSPSFSFSLDSFSGSTGYTGGAVSSPSGYVLGAQVPSVTWDSNSVSSSGEVVFKKTIAYNGTGGAGATGSLADTAVVENGNTILAQSSALVMGVSAAPMVKLTISKTISPAPLAAGAPPVTFTFHIIDGFGNEVKPISPVTLTFNPGDSSQSTGTISLTPSMYTVHEDAVTGWIPGPDQPVNLSANNASQCTGTASFSNTEQSHIIVTKVTNPPSDSTTVFPFNTTGAGYSGFSLTGNGDSHDSGPLNPGTYSVGENPPAGWDQTAAICTGTGNTPGTITLGAGQTVTCTFTNSQPNANIAITPSSATNEVNHQHTFTITETAIPNGDSPVVFNSITPAVLPAPSSQSSTCGSPTISGNVATCTLTINSTTAGTFTANATANLTIGTVGLLRATGDSNVGDGGPATKNFVDASIAIGPSAVNPVGQQHVFTVTVTAIPGTASPISFGAITPNVTPAPSSFSTTCSAPTVNGNVATCTVTINSTTSGSFTANVSANVTMGGVTVTRSTSGNSGPGGSGPATKSYVDASIGISPSSVNEVGHSHIFTITVTANPGTLSPVVFNSITPGVSPTPGTFTSTCASPTVNGNVATCTVTINNSTAGTFTVNAAAQLTMGGVTVNRSTDGSSGPHGPGGTGSSTKAFVDASVSIGPSATNPIGQQHVFTVIVTAIPGGASPVSFGTITPNVTPVPSSMSTSCATPTVNGNIATCTVTINSTTPGSFTANVSADVTMGGVTVTRSTSGNSGPGGSGPATKVYQAGQIRIIKNTLPPTANGSFFYGDNFGITSLTTLGGIASQTSGNLAPGNGYLILEQPANNGQTGFALVSALCDAGSTVGVINVVAGGLTTCTFTNATSFVQVVKTVNGAAPGSTDPAFSFDIRVGATPISSGGGTIGAILDTKSTSAGNGTLSFSDMLIPGNPYEMCEMVIPGYNPVFTINGSTAPLYSIPDPNGINPAWMCVNFTTAPGQTLTISVNNVKPTSNGKASTIGFWKNWASCASSSGGQKPILDETLFASMSMTPPPYGPGITIGTLVLTDTSTNKDKASDCTSAVNLLNKTTIDGKTKKASDPAFNLASQLLGAILNVDSGASIGPNDSLVISEAEILLANHNFNGTATYIAFSASEATLANSLAALLDSYNNNGLDPATVPPLITSANTATFTNGTPSTFTVTALGKATPAIAETGALPAGFSFTGGTGSATLSYSGAATPKKSTAITFTATNSAGTFTQSFTIKAQ